MLRCVQSVTGTRRTQEQRRSEMRERLLDATIESLLEDGYAATTLRAVAARAGVSSGAMTHHFPRRVDLVGAAVDSLTEQRIARFHSAELPSGARRLTRAILDLVWEDFSSDVFRVAVKLWVAADDDPELAERLEPMERLVAGEIARVVAELGGDRPRAEVAAIATTVLATIRGLALTDAFRPGGGRSPEKQWALVRPVLEGLLLPAS